MKKSIIICAFLLLMAGLAAQSQTLFVPTNNASAYSYEGVQGDAAKLKIKTYIWGQVQKPGLYTVPDDTDLLTLISLAGGPKEDAKLSKIRIVRPTIEGEHIIWINMKDYLESGNEKMIPVLQPGDTVVVSGTIFYAFTRVTDFLSKAAIALSVYNLIVNL
ncbi:MAG TPA: SLBB domain-containing protein [Candidatus Cloacimonadota bacterium]|nr:SLBB domain-containing protein [Candidatus Cloacimonadota bacterium]HOV16618.1 SLBB domain-containing protein [Candidatus Cloacimonadota bacterium]HQL15154.1 SLBB domain-containing protein [Candidatus Cloacimonadota bacterium]